MLLHDLTLASACSRSVLEKGSKGLEQTLQDFLVQGTLAGELLVQGGTLHPDLFGHLYLEKTFVGLFDNAKIKSAVPEFVCDLSLHDGLKMMVEWFEREANQVDPVKDAMEDRLVELHAGWKDQMQEAFRA